MNETQVDLEAGLDTLREREEVRLEDATGELHTLYEEVQETLRVPMVNALFRSLAAGPPFLAPAWRGMAPLIRTQVFEERADRLRMEAARLVGPRPSGLTLDLPDADEALIRGFLDGAHYVLPKLALIAELFDRAARGDTRGSVDLAGPEVPRGIIKDVPRLPLPTRLDVEPALQRTYKEIQRRHDQPFVASFYRGLTAWPLVLQSFWGTVSSEVGTDHYLDRRKALQGYAHDLVSEVRLPHVELPGLNEDDRKSIRDLLGAFRMRIIPDTLQDVTILKIALDDQRAAERSRFSTTRRVR